MSDQNPPDAISLYTVRAINKALRANREGNGGKVFCLQEGNKVRIYHAKQPKNGALQVAKSDGLWFHPGEVWVEPVSTVMANQPEQERDGGIEAKDAGAQERQELIRSAVAADLSLVRRLLEN
jgi:hypothetical protein